MRVETAKEVDRQTLAVIILYVNHNNKKKNKKLHDVKNCQLTTYPYINEPVINRDIISI